MKLLKIAAHGCLVLAVLFVLAVYPAMRYLNLFASGSDTDAASSASLPLPDSPSGDFLVLLNTSLHADSVEDWQMFLSDPEELPIIWEDVQCIVAAGDASGQQLAERIQAELAENQMTVRTENPTLLASKAEAGLADMVIFSQEMADALGLTADAVDAGLTVITVTGGGE